MAQSYAPFTATPVPGLPPQDHVPQTARVSGDWTRLGRFIAAERRRQKLTVATLADLAALGARTIQSIEAGSRDNYRPATLMDLERALGWPDGTVAAVLGGGEPERAADAQWQRLAVLWPRLTARQQRALLAFVEEYLP